GLDLVREHRRGERAGGLVLVDVLAVCLVALHEVALRPPEPAGAPEPDLDGLGHDATPEFARSASAHVISSLGRSRCGSGRCSNESRSTNIRQEPRRYNTNRENSMAARPRHEFCLARSGSKL